MNGIGTVAIRPASWALVLSAMGLLAAPPAMAEATPVAQKPLTLSLSTELALAPKARVGAALGAAGGRDPYAIAVGDFDGDGKPDLAVTNHAGSTVSILLNDSEAQAAEGRYRLVASFAVGSLPHAVVGGDFNGDGRPDLATANIGDSSVSILLADSATSGEVHFNVLNLPIEGLGPIAIAATDFNGDGKLDLATANYYGGTVSILLNDTVRGSMAARFSVVTSLMAGMDSGPYALAIGDFNGDGKPDLATANSYDNSVAILINDTLRGSREPRFIRAASPAVGQGPIAIAVGDFNGDHQPDLVTANHYDDSLSILLNETAPGAAGASFGIAANTIVGLNSGLTAVAVVDFNGDGKPDLVTANDGSDSLSILGNDTAQGAAAVRFSVVASPVVSGNLYALAIGDFNRDGKPDLAVTSGGNSDGSTVSTLSNDTPARLLLQPRTLQARDDDRLSKP